MYYRWTDRAKQVMRYAVEEAHRGYWTRLTAAHVMCGMLLERTGVAGAALINLGVTLADVRRYIPPKADMPNGSEHWRWSTPPHDESVTMLIDWAVEDATRLRDNVIGTEHLLLGLLRQTEGPAIAALRSAGLDNAEVRSYVLHLLGHDQSSFLGGTASRRVHTDAPSSFRQDVSELIVKHMTKTGPVDPTEVALINCVASCVTAVDVAGGKR